MKELADFLEKMDIYFAEKKPNERLVLVVIPALVVGYVAWTLLATPSEKAKQESVANKQRIEKKLTENKRYLQSITRNGNRNYRIEELDKIIAIKKKKAALYRKRIGVLDSNLQKLSDMLFNQKSWSLFLDSITTQAHENNVQINRMTNEYVDTNGSFGHVLEVGVTCQGSFDGILKFMNDMEQNTLVTDIYNTKLYTKPNSTQVSADIHISVWGVNH